MRLQGYSAESSETYFCLMCTCAILPPSLHVLPDKLPTKRGQHHNVRQTFYRGVVTRILKISSHPVTASPFRVTRNPFRVTHPRRKHTEQAQPTCGIYCVVHVAGKRDELLVLTVLAHLCYHWCFASGALDFFLLEYDKINDMCVAPHLLGP